MFLPSFIAAFVVAFVIVFAIIVKDELKQNDWRGKM